MLDLSLYYRQDPVTDVFRRGDPKYVGRVISSMVRNGLFALGFKQIYRQKAVGA